MKMEEKLNEIENLLADFDNNVCLLRENLLEKYDKCDIDDIFYNHDIRHIEELNRYIKHAIYTISDFLGKKND